LNNNLLKQYNLIITTINENMSEPTWNEVNPSKGGKKRYILSESIDEGGCMKCFYNFCKFPNCPGKKVQIPDEMTRFMKNPTKKKEMSDVLKRSDLSTILEKNAIFSICNYSFGNNDCRNCTEGRFHNVVYNGKSMTLCYPAKNNNPKPSITVGVHCDIIFDLKGKNYDVFFVPLLYEPVVHNDFPEMVSSVEKKAQKVLSFKNIINSVEKNDIITEYEKPIQKKEMIIEHFECYSNAEPEERLEKDNKKDYFYYTLSQKLIRENEELSRELSKKNRNNKDIVDMMTFINTRVTNQILKDTDYFKESEIY
jgi:hypothetical protein